VRADLRAEVRAVSAFVHSVFAEYVCSEQICDALKKAPIPPSSTAQIFVQCWMEGWGLFFWFQLQHLGSLSISAAPA
jgi:hypothetical protein